MSGLESILDPGSLLSQYPYAIYAITLIVEIGKLSLAEVKNMLKLNRRVGGKAGLDLCLPDCYAPYP